MHHRYANAEQNVEREFLEQPAAAQLLDVAWALQRPDPRRCLLEQLGGEPDKVHRAIDRCALALRFQQFADEHPGEAMLLQLRNASMEEIVRLLF